MLDAEQPGSWCSGAGGTPTINDMRRLRRRLRRTEQQTGKRLLFGGNLGGGRGGGRCWTTVNALRHAGLLDDFAALTESAKLAVQTLREEVDDRLDSINVAQKGLLLAMVRLQNQLKKIAEEGGL